MEGGGKYTTVTVQRLILLTILPLFYHRECQSTVLRVLDINLVTMIDHYFLLLQS